MKNTLLFTYSTNILVRLLTEELSYPKTQKMSDHILVTLLKTQPHYGQSTQSWTRNPAQRHIPLASYKEVPLLPGNQDVVDSSMSSLDNYVRS